MSKNKDAIAWAVCRLPYTDEPVLFLQTAGEVETLSRPEELNGREGFVMAPFQESEELPILLIRPDQTLNGWNAAQEYVPMLSASALAENYSADTDRIPHEAAADYTTSFDSFLKALHEGTFHKLVLSRRQVAELPQDFSPWEAFREACKRYPRMMVYLCYTPQAGLWMGSSPEIILSGRQHHWHTVALAGTMPLEEGKLPTSWSAKNSLEQRYVSDYLRSWLHSSGQILKEEGPYTVQAGQLAHLKTDFHFILPTSQCLGDVLAMLHPTPAVCGLPKEEARRFILTHEASSRRYYAGFIGWISPTRSTELYVNLRCMEILPPHACLYAGGGIMPQSELDSEWNETAQKMMTMQAVLSCAR